MTATASEPRPPVVACARCGYAPRNTWQLGLYKAGVWLCRDRMACRRRVEAACFDGSGVRL